VKLVAKLVIKAALVNVLEDDFCVFDRNGNSQCLIVVL